MLLGLDGERDARLGRGALGRARPVCQPQALAEQRPRLRRGGSPASLGVCELGGGRKPLTLGLAMVVLGARGPRVELCRPLLRRQVRGIRFCMRLLARRGVAPCDSVAEGLVGEQGIARVAHALEFGDAAVAHAHHGAAAVAHADVEPADLGFERSSLPLALGDAIGMCHGKSIEALAAALVANGGVVVVAAGDDAADAELEQGVPAQRVEPALHLAGLPARARRVRHGELHVHELVFHR